MPGPRWLPLATVAVAFGLICLAGMVADAWLALARDTRHLRRWLRGRWRR